MRETHSSGTATDQTPSYTPAAIRVFHTNDFRDACSGGYQPHHTVSEVFAYTVARGASDTDYVLLREVWSVLNVGEDPAFGAVDARAVDYRKCRNRSLSVGDVVSVGTCFYACEPSGWALIPRPVIDQRGSHGTTPLYETPVRPWARSMARMAAAARRLGWAARP